VRRGWCLLAFVGVGLQASPAESVDGPAPADRPWRLAMPYSCSIEQGAVAIRPGPERTFEVAGPREERLFTTCDPPFSNNCRSLTVHKFDVLCGTDKVSWPRIVAAIGRTTAGEAVVSKGHLVLVRDADPATGHAPSCSDKKGSAAAGGECLPWRVRKPTERIVLPQNFAPLQEVGARLVDGTMPSVYAAADVMALGRGLQGSGPYRITPDSESDEAFDKLQPVAAQDTSSPDQDHGAGWTTSLSFSKVEEASPELVVASLSDRPPSAVSSGSTVAPPATPLLPWVALLACLGLAAFYFYRTQQLRLAVPDWTEAAAGARRNIQRLRDRAHDIVGDLHNRLAVSSNDDPVAPEGKADPALSSALLQLKAMLARTEAAVAMLSSQAVVREVMQSELAVIRGRIEEAERASHRGSTPVMKLAAQFRQIARDIDRVQNIAQSASRSFSIHAQATSIPTSVTEAYALIGVDPTDGEIVAKRVIDGLRMSSHPDHAQNEADRLDRESRIKQINVASDLITGRRQPG
jgi:hypothetical protein